jgi:hypothetical protein
MTKVHRAVLATAAVCIALVAVAYALEGIGLAAIVAIGLLVVGAGIIPGIAIYEEETHLPSARHGYRR